METEVKGTLRQVINQYLTIKWMYQRRVVVYEISGPLMMQEVAETWYMHVKNIVDAWPAQLPYLAIHDTTNANVSVSPYLASRIRELYKMRPDLTQRIGIVMPRTIAAQLIKVLVRGNDRDTLQNRFFFTREKAVNWLLEGDTRESQ